LPFIVVSIYTKLTSSTGNAHEVEYVTFMENL